ncbi:MAG: hypothetical protein C0609_03285 [Deltaproteobacteria bacterium]|nr:MAG: hypothetical protein C0609_03285 [Deltaproteobacteria bacterium]
MKKSLIITCCLATFAAAPFCAAEVHEVVKGDTLWDLSGTFWNQPLEWPKLWANNPHIHNPHWIYPGDLISTELMARPSDEGMEVRLPYAKLYPEVKGEPEAMMDDSASINGGSADDGGMNENAIVLLGRGVEDYISPAPVERLADVRSSGDKVMTALREEVFFDLAAPDAMAPGDLVTIFNDDRVVMHPGLMETVSGRHVKILAHAEILEVVDSSARAVIFSVNDVVVPGSGVMAYREPVNIVVPKKAGEGLEGVVLAGDENKLLYGAHDTIFMDKGAAQGVESGMILEVPFDPDHSAEGILVDAKKPSATLVVVATEEDSSTAYILDSRTSVVAGNRFAAVSVSP